MLFLKQNLIQHCTYKQASLKTFFNFMDSFYDLCFKSNDFSYDCSKKVVEKNELSWTSLLKCVEESFLGSQDKPNEAIDDNYVLSDSRSAEQRYGLFTTPALVVNGQVVDRKLSAISLFDSFCESMVEKPDLCFKFIGKEVTENAWSSFLVFILFLVVFGVSIIGIWTLFLKRLVKHVMNGKEVATKIGESIRKVKSSQIDVI